jgi:cyclic pyranopterin monophosphate synthase
MDDMNHLDERGNVHMVDVGAKDVTDRVAVAAAVVEMDDATRDRLFSDDLPKGDALATARIAAISGAKRTPDLIPLCHPLAISGVSVTIEQVPEGARITTTVSVTAKTGVEMEAMTAASVGALAIYDMVKGIDRGARISSVELLSKSGGRSGEWRRG